VRNYTEAVQWFAAAHLLQQAGRAGWGKVDGQDVQCWMVWLLGRYSTAYASNQYRGLQQFFKWLASGTTSATRGSNAAGRKAT
jgi:hypothetical protein